MNIRAITFDLDDTLLRDDLTISDYTVRVMHRAAAEGIRILPASGRARDSMKPFVELLSCSAAYISSNGAEVWTPAHTLLRAFSFPEETALAIADFARDHGCYAQTYSGSHFYYNIENQYAFNYARASMLTGFLTPDLKGFIHAHPSCKVLMMDEPERVAEMLAEARIRFAGQASVTCSKPFFLEFNPPEATKGNALAFCAERLGFRLEDVLAFGDSLNDLSMLEAAGCGVAVANAREDVKRRLGRVCGSNMADGPARYTAALLWGEEEIH